MILASTARGESGLGCLGVANLCTGLGKPLDTSLLEKILRLSFIFGNGDALTIVQR
jgi:hypothetical protein